MRLADSVLTITHPCGVLAGGNPATGEVIKIKAKTAVKLRWPSPPRMPSFRLSPSDNDDYVQSAYVATVAAYAG